LVTPPLLPRSPARPRSRTARPTRRAASRPARPSSPPSARAAPAAPARGRASAPTGDCGGPSVAAAQSRPPRREQRHDRDVHRPRLVDLVGGALEADARSPAAISQRLAGCEAFFVDPQALAFVRADEAVPFR